MMWGYGIGWGWMWIGGILLALILLALIAVIVLVSVGLHASWRSPSITPQTPALRLAQERLARGEIDSEEFARIARALDESGATI